jgi:simple sugar transport system substrate-binding protein
VSRPDTPSAIPAGYTNDRQVVETSPGRKRGLVVGLAILAVTIIIVVIAIVVPSARPNANGSGGSPTSTTGSGHRYTVAMITYEAPGDTFWDKVRNGAAAAATQHGIDLKYSNSPDPNSQATLVQNASDSKVDAMAVSLPGSSAVTAAVKRAADAGTPAVALVGGLDQYRQAGAQAYFGIDDELAGQAIGQRITSEHGKEVVCVIPAQGVVALESRCAGVKKGFPNTKNLQVDGADAAAVAQTITAYLQTYPSVSHIVTLIPPTAVSAVSAKRAAGSTVAITAFGLNMDVGNAIQDGDIDFSYDQMPYEQGYQAVTALWDHLANDVALNSIQFSGPSFVDKSNIAQVLPGIANNTR